MTGLNKYFTFLAIVAVILFLGVGGYFYYQAQKNVKIKIDPQFNVQEEKKRIVAEVNKLIDLPAGEDPTVATVTDIDKLKDQSFFQKAKNGDKVLIYTSARKAILYDPVSHKVMDVAPINVGSPAAQIATVNVILRNGTTVTGLTSKVETGLKKSFPALSVVAKENAEKQNYSNTVVVIINDSAKDLAGKIAKSLNATVSGIPAGEIKPKNGDILIILGKDNT